MSNRVRPTFVKQALGVIHYFADFPDPDIRVSGGLFLILLGVLLFDYRVFFIVLGVLLITWARGFQVPIAGS